MATKKYIGKGRKPYWKPKSAIKNLILIVKKKNDENSYELLLCQKVREDWIELVLKNIIKVVQGSGEGCLGFHFIGSG